MTRYAICENVTDKGSSIRIECKVNHSTKIIEVFPGDDDYDIAKQLTPGDKIAIETRDTELKSTKNIEIPQGKYPITYITKKIETR